MYEEGPRGKGHAVRTGLKHVTGTIVLIQDADFEYDINDYDALLEPILQHKATFVLGSRSLGLDDWKVRKYDSTPIRGLALNFAQVVFAKTYDVLYQQRVTDVNTMYKVFRAECLDGLDLESNGFELDIELACKLARNGNSPDGGPRELHRARLRRGQEDPLLARRDPRRTPRSSSTASGNQLCVAVQRRFTGRREDGKIGGSHGTERCERALSSRVREHQHKIFPSSRLPVNSLSSEPSGYSSFFGPSL